MTFQVGDRIQGVDEYSFITGTIVELLEGPKIAIIVPDSYKNPLGWSSGIRWSVWYEWIKLVEPAAGIPAYMDLFI